MAARPLEAGTTALDPTPATTPAPGLATTADDKPTTTAGAPAVSPADTATDPQDAADVGAGVLTIDEDWNVIIPPGAELEMLPSVEHTVCLRRNGAPAPGRNDEVARALGERGYAGVLRYGKELVSLGAIERPGPEKAGVLGLAGRPRGELTKRWLRGKSGVRFGSGVGFDVEGEEETVRTIIARFDTQTHKHRIFFSFCKGTP